VVSRDQDARNQRARNHHGGNPPSGWQADILGRALPGEDYRVMDLHDDDTTKLVVEVDDPETAVKLINSATGLR
jgi:hypothetical protein